MSYEVWGEPDDPPELPEGWWDEDQVAEAKDRIAALEAEVARLKAVLSGIQQRCNESRPGEVGERETIYAVHDMASSALQTEKPA